MHQTWLTHPVLLRMISSGHFPMKTKQEPAQSRLHTMPTHVPSHHRASPFLDDVIINQAVEKTARDLAPYSSTTTCAFTLTAGRRVWETSCCQNRAVVMHLRLLQETNKMFSDNKQHLVFTTRKNNPQHAREVPVITVQGRPHPLLLSTTCVGACNTDTHSC